MCARVSICAYVVCVRVPKYLCVCVGGGGCKSEYMCVCGGGVRGGARVSICVCVCKSERDHL